MEADCPFVHIDSKAIHTDLEYRIRYLHSFLDFNQSDIDALVSGARYIKALIPNVVDAMYSKLLQHDITAQSFSKKGKEEPENGDDTLPNGKSPDVLRRKIFFRWYLTKLCSDPSKMEYWEYMDKVGRMHIGRDRPQPLYVDYAHIALALGFVMDIFVQALMSHSQIPFGRKLGLLRALIKVMWIQNDLFARYQVHNSQESSGGSTDPHNASNGSSNDVRCTLQKPQGVRSHHSHHSSQPLSEASTIARPREDDATSLFSAVCPANGAKNTSSTSSSATTDSMESLDRASRLLTTPPEGYAASQTPSNSDQVYDDVPTIPLIINNELCVAKRQFDVHNPSTGNLIGRGSNASVNDANVAVDAAQAAFRVWSKMQPYARRDIMMRAADIMLDRKEELIRYQREETGAGRLFAEHTFMLAVSFLRDFAARISSIEGSVPTVANEGRYAMVIREPYGVILGIIPWNAPYLHSTRVIALPLAAGNTIVVKGSELAPRCFWAIGDVYREAGLPAGCVNVLFHKPSQQSSSVINALIAHPSVRKVNFMGSNRVGSIVAGIAGRYVKPVVLGLGGKASAIVLDDANLGKAAMGCIVGSFMHGGQTCMSTERIIVQRSIADKFRQALVETAHAVFEKDAPPPVLIAMDAVKRNKDLVADAISKGANILFGDASSSNLRESSSASMRPFIVENVSRDMEMYFVESFGPIVSLMVVDSEEDAVALTNDTEYGLSVAIYTENLFRAIRVGREVQCGAIHVNSTTIHDSPGLPHGGWKSSGFGRTGGGASCYDDFLQTKTITWVDQ